MILFCFLCSSGLLLPNLKAQNPKPLSTLLASLIWSFCSYQYPMVYSVENYNNSGRVLWLGRMKASFSFSKAWRKLIVLSKVKAKKKLKYLSCYIILRWCFFLRRYFKNNIFKTFWHMWTIQTMLFLSFFIILILSVLYIFWVVIQLQRTTFTSIIRNLCQTFYRINHGFRLQKDGFWMRRLTDHFWK